MVILYHYSSISTNYPAIAGPAVAVVNLYEYMNEFANAAHLN